MTDRPPPAPMTIQLNRAAVDALFANDPEARVKLTHAVIEHVAKAHVIKAVENDPAILALYGSMSNRVASEVEKHAKVVYDRSSRMCVLTDETKNVIAKSVRTVIEAQVLNAIKSHLSVINFEKVVHGIADEYIRNQINASVRGLMEEKYRKAISELVK